ncbi:MAG: ABC transporter permease [Cyanobium sp.]
MFVFTGTLLWSILIDALNAPLQQVNANKALLAKINFPPGGTDPQRHRADGPQRGDKLGILLLVLPFLGVHPGWGGLLIPVGLLSLVLTGTAVGLLFTPLGVLYGDIGRDIPLITQIFDVPDPGVVPPGFHRLDSPADATQPAHAADPQCLRLIHRLAAAATERVNAGAGKLSDAGGGGPAGDADPDRADACLRWATFWSEWRT